MTPPYEQIEHAVDKVLAAYLDECIRYRDGEKALLGFFVGKVMRAIRGNGNPAVVVEVLHAKLGRRE